MKIDELYFRPLEFGIDNMLGHIVDLKKEDYLCVEVSNLTMFYSLRLRLL